MKITYDPAADRGSQFCVEMESGTTVSAVSMATAQGLAMSAGKSIRQVQMLIAEAKLKAASDAESAAARAAT
jgi:hypothetical protein